MSLEWATKPDPGEWSWEVYAYDHDNHRDIVRVGATTALLAVRAAEAVLQQKESG